MKLGFDIILIAFAAFWLIMVARDALRGLGGLSGSRLLIGTPALVGLLGGAAFFAQAFSPEGIIQLPSSYEWPAGFVQNVIVTQNGTYVVPLVPSGRVQLYDSNWRFLRGWNVTALGGDFRVASDSPGAIEVYTARGMHHYTFGESGELMRSAGFLGPYESLPRSGQSVIVRTPLVLWPLSSPFIAVAVALAGFSTFALMKRLANRSR